MNARCLTEPYAHAGSPSEVTHGLSAVPSGSPRSSPAPEGLQGGGRILPGVLGVRFPCPPPCREAARCEALGLRPVPAARGAPEARSPPEAPPPFPQRSARALPPPRAPGREPAATPVPFTRMPAPVPSRCGLPGPFSPCRCPPPSSSSHGSRASHRLRAGRPRWRLLREPGAAPAGSEGVEMEAAAMARGVRGSAEGELN